MMEYRVIMSDRNLDALVVRVNQAIADGWKPLGGVAIALQQNGGRYYTVFAQAVIKEGDDGTQRTYT